jgi:phosphopantetheinyl transferase
VAPVTSLLHSIAVPAIDVWLVTLEPIDRRQRRQQARDAMRDVLAAELREPAGELDLAVAPGGKPYLAGRDLHFNLSHSGAIACVATSTAVPVGVDVERVRTFKNETGMRRRICAPAELAWLQSIPTVSESQAALIRLWVRKEAVVKASGEGIVRDLNEFSVLDGIVDDGRGGRWSCADIPIPTRGYLAAVAFPALQR